VNAQKLAEPTQPNSLAREETARPLSFTAGIHEKYLWAETPRIDPEKRPVHDRVKDFQEIETPFDENTVIAQASRCIQCAMPFCTVGCPLSSPVPQWLGLVAEGRFLEAAAICRANGSLPEICARLCPAEQFCEGMCTLSERSDPIPIRAIEEYLYEYAFNRQAAPGIRPPPNGLCVAVVGSGPAGLACADELAMRGYAVTVFEAYWKPSGTWFDRIPSFKLDKSVVARRLEILHRRGIAFDRERTFGHDLALDDLVAEFDAVFLGLDAQQPRPADLPGVNLAGVMQAVSFLLQTNSIKAPNHISEFLAGRQVAVLGGGDTALDCVRTALRCGVRSATCLYRRDWANMPGSRREYQNAVEEGAQFLFFAQPVRLEGGPEGCVTQVHCLRTELGELDALGRCQLRLIPNSEFTVPADLVLIAYGFDPLALAPSALRSNLAINAQGTLVVDSNQATNIPRVFAGGDLVRGPSLAIYGITDGRNAAAAIDRYLTA
jgi:glutamate synthase (NADPH/NADH) small chain